MRNNDAQLLQWWYNACSDFVFQKLGKFGTNRKKFNIYLCNALKRLKTNLHLKGLNRMVVVSFWNAIKRIEINLICFSVGQGINRILLQKCSFQPFLLISRSSKKVLDLFLILLFSSSSSFFAIVTGAPIPAVLWRWALWCICNIYVESY